MSNRHPHTLPQVTARSAAAVLGVDSSEIRAIIVSTHWTELLVPFSHFKRSWSSEIRGYELTLAEDDLTPVAAFEVTSLVEASERGITPVHLIILGRGDGLDVEAAWQESVRLFSKVGADDVLGVEFEHGQHGLLLYLILGNMIADDPRTTLLDELADEIPDDEEPEAFAVEHRALAYAVRRFDYSVYEIDLAAYPDKFATLQETGNWRLKRVFRAGVFASQKELYPDELLLERIVNRGGQSQIRFRGSSRAANYRHWNRFKDNLSYCLAGADGWRDVFLAWLEDVACKHSPPLPSVTVRVTLGCLWRVGEFAGRLSVSPCLPGAGSG